MTIKADTMAHILIEWSHAPYGQKTHIIKRWAKALNVEHKTIYRAMQQITGKSKKERADTGKYKNPHLVEWTEAVWGIKTRPPKDCGVIATDQAIQIAYRAGAIPAEAARIHPSTYNRIARQQGLNRTEGRHRLNQAEKANFKHVFDASTSKFLYIDRCTPDGLDYILKLHTPSQNYKNKPIPCDRLRPWLYGVVDDHSGMLYTECVAAKGESAADAITFLKNAWARKGSGADSKTNKLNGSRHGMGLPKLLRLDNGPLAKALPVKEFMDRLDITMIKGEPGNSKAGGKIERPWRTLWGRFELLFFSQDSYIVAGWARFEITLSEYNRQLQNCLLEYNAMAHRYWKDLSREAAWWNSINEQGGLIDISPEAFKSVFQRHRRKVEGGYFSLDNKLYEVAGFDNGWAHIYEGVFDDRLVAVDIKTHRKHQVKLFVPQTWGQKIELVKSKAELLAEESREKISITTPYYEEAPDTKVAKLPVRGQIKEIADPLSLGTGHCPEQSAIRNPQLFESPGERYEHLIKLRAQGEELTDTDIQFMNEFEQTEIYKQLAGTFKKWENFYLARCQGQADAIAS